MNVWRSIFNRRRDYDALPQTELAAAGGREMQLEISDMETAMVGAGAESCRLERRACSDAAPAGGGARAPTQFVPLPQLSIQGMTCSACSTSVENALRCVGVRGCPSRRLLTAARGVCPGTGPRLRITIRRAGPSQASSAPRWPSCSTRQRCAAACVAAGSSLARVAACCLAASCAAVCAARSCTARSAAL